MRWRKLGLLFCARGQHPWMVSHASTPVAEVISGSLIRVYFSTRDAANRSSIAALVFDLQRPGEILDLAPAPLVGPGAPGWFDDSGASAGCLVRHGDRRLLYYVGWNLGVTVPWRNSIGLAVSQGGDGFAKHAPAPIMDRGPADPFSLSYPWVMLEGAVWRMWYGSNTSWGPRKEDMRHVIKYAESDDGVSWRRSGLVALGLAGGTETALARPCVLRDASGYHLWFSHRGERYRIGYAQSADGLQWRRDDRRSGLDVSADGWDAEMVEYPCVFAAAGAHFMLYNGNGYGRTGFGLAEAV